MSSIVRNNKQLSSEWSTVEWWCYYQYHSYDLVVYSILISGPVRIAWPTVKVGDAIVPVEPEDLPAWLLEHGLYWPCWCAYSGTGGPYPCRLEKYGLHKVRYMAFCHYSDSRCGFEMDLGKKFSMTDFLDDYGHLESVESVTDFEKLMKPYVELFERDAESDHSEDGGSGSEELDESVALPFFKGYCGEMEDGP
ncbi:hypothetical protein MD484_g3506, partial [Candolleomyces efflorescens]